MRRGCGRENLPRTSEPHTIQQRPSYHHAWQPSSSRSTGRSLLADWWTRGQPPIGFAFRVCVPCRAPRLSPHPPFDPYLSTVANPLSAAYVRCVSLRSTHATTATATAVAAAAAAASGGGGGAAAAAAAAVTGLITEPPFRSGARHERRVSVMELWRPPRNRVTSSRRTACPRSSRASRSPSCTWRACTSGVHRTTGNDDDSYDMYTNCVDTVTH